MTRRRPLPRRNDPAPARLRALESCGGLGDEDMLTGLIELAHERRPEAAFVTGHGAPSGGQHSARRTGPEEGR